MHLIHFCIFHTLIFHIWFPPFFYCKIKDYFLLIKIVMCIYHTTKINIKKEITQKTKFKCSFHSFHDHSYIISHTYIICTITLQKSNKCHWKITTLHKRQKYKNPISFHSLNHYVHTSPLHMNFTSNQLIWVHQKYPTIHASSTPNISHQSHPKPTKSHTHTHTNPIHL